MKLLRICLFLLAFLAAFASATIKIIFPSAQYYLVAGQTNEIQWTYDVNDTVPFSIYLTNPTIADLKQFALENNVDPKLAKKNVEIGMFVGTGFQIMFTNISNIATVYATSDPFEIKPSGTQPTAYSSPTPTPSASPSDSPKNDGGNPSHKNSSNSIHNYGFGILALITLFTIILF